MSVAKKRWALLRKALLGQTSPKESTESTKPISGFGLIYSEPTSTHPRLRERPPIAPADFAPADFQDMVYRVSDSLSLRLRERRLGKAALKDHQVSQESGVDNTGNIGLWPCEEVLAYLFLVAHVRPDDISLRRHLPPANMSGAGWRVLELGAGVGLAGFILAAYMEQVHTMHLTDGNPSVVDTLQYNIESQRHSLHCKDIHASLLKWDRNDTTACTVPYDIVMSSDCLFFKDYHLDLIQTLRNTLAPHGVFVCLAPSRGGSRELFLRHLQETLEFSIHVTRLCTQDPQANDDSDWPAGVTVSSADYDPIVADQIQRLSRQHDSFTADRWIPAVMIIRKKK